MVGARLVSACLGTLLLASCHGQHPPPDSAAPTTPGPANATQCPVTQKLDDFEDGDGQIVVADGRAGYWYTYADEAGSTIAPKNDALRPTDGGANGTARAFRFAGRLAAEGTVFAGTGFSFLDPKAAYDASCCTGIRFQAKAHGCRGLVRLQVGDVNTVPEGTRCERCYDHFGKTYRLTEEWASYELRFAEMSQEGWGEQQEQIDTSQLFELSFAVKDFDCEYEVWLDEIELFGCNQ